MTNSFVKFKHLFTFSSFNNFYKKCSCFQIVWQMLCDNTLVACTVGEMAEQGGKSKKREKNKEIKLKVTF